jgi:glycine/D-amino acid oxidase-like deaminating enzyme/nitrite reductase/ring-hydroxylating ferredoxin subunit
MAHNSPTQTEIKKASSGKISTGSHPSYWLTSVEPIAYSSLKESIETEVVIVGGGIAGLTTAYCLLRAGKQVVVIDDGNIGSGETGRTTAHLVTALDDRYIEIEKHFGREDAQLIAESHATAIAKIEEIVTREKIDCDYERVSGYLFLHTTDSIGHLEDEFKAAQRVGLDVVWLNETPALPKNVGPCIEFRDQGQFHPLKYLQGLCKAIEKMGGRIFTSTRAQEFDKNGVTTADKFHIKAQHVVVATNTPVNDRVAMHTKQFPYRTYVIGATIPKGSLPHALWWDTGDQESKWITQPYHYIRLHEYDETHDILICGGEDHKTGQAEEEYEPEDVRFEVIASWAKQYFPQIEKVVFKWSGQIMEPLDDMAFIGKNPGDENIYIVTGDSGNGMTHSTIAGILLTDLIAGKRNPWEHIYDPSRKMFSVAGSYIKEAVDMAVQYTDYLTQGDVDNSEDIEPLNGAIIRDGMKKLAVYRDEKGELHTFSAVCPHLKCILEWNNAEKSFDCPCHGSRFSCTGKLLNGPAIADLEEIHEEQEH